MSRDDEKRRAAERAIAYIEDGSIVGVGTGSTVAFFIEALARVRDQLQEARVRGRLGIHEVNPTAARRRQPSQTQESASYPVCRRDVYRLSAERRRNHRGARLEQVNQLHQSPARRTLSGLCVAQRGHRARYAHGQIPLRAFDDGSKVYIQFPAGIGKGEMPPLFVIGSEGDAELVNYRVRAPYYIVDRLFGAAELRLGGKDARRVRIERTDAHGTKS